MYIMTAFSKKDFPCYQERAVQVYLLNYMAYWVVTLNPAEYAMLLLKLEVGTAYNNSSYTKKGIYIN